jgi:hypothetical protein
MAMLEPTAVGPEAQKRKDLSSLLVGWLTSKANDPKKISIKDQSTQTVQELTTVGVVASNILNAIYNNQIYLAISADISQPKIKVRTPRVRVEIIPADFLEVAGGRFYILAGFEGYRLAEVLRQSMMKQTHAVSEEDLKKPFVNETMRAIALQVRDDISKTDLERDDALRVMFELSNKITAGNNDPSEYLHASIAGELGIHVSQKGWGLFDNADGRIPLPGVFL